MPIRDLFDGTKEVDRESHEASKIYEEYQQLMDSFDGKMTEVKLSHCNYAIVMDLADRDLDECKTRCGLLLHNLVLKVSMIIMRYFHHAPEMDSFSIAHILQIDH